MVTRSSIERFYAIVSSHNAALFNDRRKNTKLCVSYMYKVHNVEVRVRLVNAHFHSRSFTWRIFNNDAIFRRSSVFYFTYKYIIWNLVSCKCITIVFKSTVQYIRLGKIVHLTD